MKPLIRHSTPTQIVLRIRFASVTRQRFILGSEPVNGFVDDELRALLEVQIGATPGSVKPGVVAWIDTAFNGGLVLPRDEIERLELKECSSTPAILADGQQVELPMFTGYLDWFGNVYRTQVVANQR